MLHNRFRIQVAMRAAAIAGLAGAAAYLALAPGLYLPAALLGGLAAGAAVSLVRYTEKVARDLTRFLESVRYADFSRRFISGGRGPVFEDLRDAFEEVTQAFREIRADKEEQVRYLENVVRHLGVALLSYRTDGHVELMNTAARRLLRTGPIRNVDALEEVSPSLVDALQTLPAGEKTMVRIEKEDRTLQLAIHVSRFHLRGTEYALASIQDLRNELEEKEMEAWQELTSVLTHEIMNSVAPISSLASTARRRIANGTDVPRDNAALEDVQEAVRTIERRSEGLIHFVDAYRSFTDLPQPTFELLSVRDLFAGVRRLLDTQVGEEGLALTTNVEPESLEVPADADMIEQVLINLTMNAVQAVEGEEHAHIELRAHVDRHSRPVLEVADNGPGIPEDVQDKIFVPFFTTKEDGSGIGLSLSRRIMRLHGGSMDVRSTPGEGTVFMLLF